MRRILLAMGIVVVVEMIGAGSAWANSWTIARPNSPRGQEIHSMDILARPNRPLHFYGDTVRLGIEAPKEVAVHRIEIVQRFKEEAVQPCAA